ncbi:MAG: IclR family transcriptional regulator [Magnetovibrio sp.]|nr:IclR family transcriptional regulator [Magnetovibrio sp.]
MTDTAKESGSALHKAVLVLDALFESDRPMGLADISATLDLPRQTVHRIVRQLEDLDLIRRDFARDHFSVGARMVTLSLNALHAAYRLAPMRTVLKDLVATIGETCNIGILDRDGVVYIDRVECDWPLRLQFRPGSRVSVHATAIGKLLLAHLPSRTRKRLITAAPLPALTENTITDPDVLEEELKTIRRRGYATNDSENLTGLIALAVPIYDGDGKVVAGLAVHAPDARMSVKKAEEHLPTMRAVAAAMQKHIIELQEKDGDKEFESAEAGSMPAD